VVTDSSYFFFELFLLLAFLDEDLAADFFDAAIVFTTFHAVRDLPVAPSWQISPDDAGKLVSVESPGQVATTRRRPTTFTDRCGEFMVIIVLTCS
jgi:hypothetical protein